MINAQPTAAKKNLYDTEEKKGVNMAKKRKSKGLANRFRPNIVACLLLVLFCFCFLDDIFDRSGSTQAEWNLIVVNQWNELPEDYHVELTELSNGQKVDSRIYPSLQEMFDDARAEGVYPFVREGYRTAQDQQDILDERIQAYINEGLCKSEARHGSSRYKRAPAGNRCRYQCGYLHVQQ